MKDEPKHEEEFGHVKTRVGVEEECSRKKSNRGKCLRTRTNLEDSRRRPKAHMAGVYE